MIFRRVFDWFEWVMLVIVWGYYVYNNVVLVWIDWLRIFFIDYMILDIVVKWSKFWNMC